MNNEQSVLSRATYFDPEKFNHYTNASPEGRKEIIAAFIDTTPGLLDLLTDLLEQGRAKLTFKTVHKLKSGCALFCTASLHAEIMEVEKAAVHIDTPEYASAVRRLINRIHLLLAELRAFVSQDAANHQTVQL